ncbi:MAG: hypothetical protein ACLPN1_04245 [Dissulfurispiraceae bacterium]|jgi:hypothetical protein
MAAACPSPVRDYPNCVFALNLKRFRLIRQPDVDREPPLKIVLNWQASLTNPGLALTAYTPYALQEERR